MGEVIRRDAATDDILADLRTTLARAREKKGVWQELAEKRLDAISKLCDKIDARLEKARKEAKPLLLALAAADGRADDLLGSVADDVWNVVGRPGPGSDPVYAIMFPGGYGYYAEGMDDQQPDRMDLLADLIESGIHPKIPAGKAKDLSRSVRDEASEHCSALFLGSPLGVSSSGRVARFGGSEPPGSAWC